MTDEFEKWAWDSIKTTESLLEYVTLIQMAPDLKGHSSLALDKLAQLLDNPETERDRFTCDLACIAKMPLPDEERARSTLVGNFGLVSEMAFGVFDKLVTRTTSELKGFLYDAVLPYKINESDAGNRFCSIEFIDWPGFINALIPFSKGFSFIGLEEFGGHFLVEALEAGSLTKGNGICRVSATTHPAEWLKRPHLNFLTPQNCNLVLGGNRYFSSIEQEALSDQSVLEDIGLTLGRLLRDSLSEKNNSYALNSCPPEKAFEVGIEAGQVMVGPGDSLRSAGLRREPIKHRFSRNFEERFYLYFAVVIALKRHLGYSAPLILERSSSGFWKVIFDAMLEGYVSDQCIVFYDSRFQSSKNIETYVGKHKLRDKCSFSVLESKFMATTLHSR